MTLRTLSVLAVAALALAGSAVPASADPISPGKIHLTVTSDDPQYGPDNSLVYYIRVHNLGPDTATGVIVHLTAWFCKDLLWSASSCQPQMDPNNPSKPLTDDGPLDALAAGGQTSFPFTSYLPDANSGFTYSHTIAEVVKSDQEDSASVPGTCREGLNPQDDCVSAVATAG